MRGREGERTHSDEIVHDGCTLFDRDSLHLSGAFQAWNTESCVFASFADSKVCGG